MSGLSKAQEPNQAIEATPRFRHWLVRMGIDSEDAQQVELKAFVELTALAGSQEDPSMKQFVEDYISGELSGATSRFTYIRDEIIKDEVRSAKAGIKRLPPVDLCVAMEGVLANSINSSGYTKQIFRKQRRWNAIVPNHIYKSTDMVSPMRPGMSPLRFKSAYYKIGVHHLAAGSAIVEMLYLIEERYGLSFNKLESARKKTITG